MSAVSAGSRSKAAQVTISGAPSAACFRTLSRYAKSEFGRAPRLFGPVGRHDARFDQTSGHIRVVSSRVGPDRAADRARDRQAELEAREALPLA